jgi:hypothetical protein
MAKPKPEKKPRWIILGVVELSPPQRGAGPT